MKLTKKEFSWVLYDCGNSAYSMAVTTALFPVFFGMLSSGNSMDYGYFASIASIIVAILSPILGTYADYKDKKKKLFIFFASLGVIFTLFLAILPTSSLPLIVIAYVITCIGFAGANIFYDSFLVDVATNDRMDSVSTKGFAYGYITSVIPFGISLGIILLLGMDNIVGYQLGFVITALWWGFLTMPMIKHVKQVHYIEQEPNPIRNSFKRLISTFKNIKKFRVAFFFLIAYFLYIDGVDTIIKMAVPFSTEVLNLDSNDVFLLLGILLVIQIIAFPCAIIYGKLAKRFSTRSLILVGISSYIVACLFAFTMTEVWHIFILGGIIGSAQGGIQALSRSYFAKAVPKERSSEFFGFYNIFGKFAAIIGPALMAFVSSATGNTRLSILVLIPLFAISFVFMLLLPKDSAGESLTLE